MKNSLGETIKTMGKDSIVSLHTERYGCFWVGKAKFVFGAVNAEAWNKSVKEKFICGDVTTIVIE